MKLDEWMKLNNVSQPEMAEMLETTIPTISRVRRGINTPSLDLAIKIVELTKNEVTLQDLVKSWGTGRGGL